MSLERGLSGSSFKSECWSMPPSGVGLSRTARTGNELFAPGETASPCTLVHISKGSRYPLRDPLRAAIRVPLRVLLMAGFDWAPGNRTHAGAYTFGFYRERKSSKAHE